MTQAVPCPGCGCRDPSGATPHLVNMALAEGNIDRAIQAGMLDCGVCEGCGPACTAGLLAARDARLAAWAARERYRARNARGQRRAAELAARRAPASPVAATAAMPRPALPAAAAAVLARAKAKAAERRKT